MNIDPVNEKMMRVRAEALFAPYQEMIRGKRLLEIAPFDGWFTDYLFRTGARHLTLVEANPAAVSLLQQRFEDQLKARRLELRLADVHLELGKLEGQVFDTIVCVGFLYHSLHPAWCLEGMASLGAKHILIETFDCNLEFGDEVPNVPGNAFSNRRFIPGTLKLPRDVIVNWMKLLGYAPVAEVKRGHLTNVPEELGLVGSHASYFQAWLQEYALWFERVF